MRSIATGTSSKAPWPRPAFRLAEPARRLYLGVLLYRKDEVRVAGLVRPARCRAVPKIKSKRSAMKRFRLTGTGKVRRNFAGKRHGMIKRSTKFIRNTHGTTIASAPDARYIKRYLLRNP